MAEYKDPISYGYFGNRENLHRVDLAPSEKAQSIARSALLQADRIELNVPTHEMPLGEMVIQTGFLYGALRLIREQNPKATVVLKVNPGAPFFFSQFRKEGTVIEIHDPKNSPKIYPHTNSLAIDFGLVAPQEPGVSQYGYPEQWAKRTQISNIGGLLYRYTNSVYGNRRYDTAVRSLFGFPPLHSGQYSQPRIDLPQDLPLEKHRQTAITIGIIPEANYLAQMTLDGIEFHNRKHLSKDQWKQIIVGMVAHCSKKYPGKPITLNVFLNPERPKTRFHKPSPLEGSEEELNQLVSTLNSDARIAFKRINLPQLAEESLRQNIFIANDTGPAHFVAAVNGNCDVIVPFSDFYNGQVMSDVWSSTHNMHAVNAPDMMRRIKRYRKHPWEFRDSKVEDIIRSSDVVAMATQHLDKNLN